MKKDSGRKLEVWFKMQAVLAFCLTACDISLHHTLHGRKEACNRIPPTEEVNYIFFFSSPLFTTSLQNKNQMHHLPQASIHSHKPPTYLVGFKSVLMSATLLHYSKTLGGTSEAPRPKWQSRCQSWENRESVLPFHKLGYSVKWMRHFLIYFLFVVVYFSKQFFRKCHLAEWWFWWYIFFNEWMNESLFEHRIKE